MASQAKTGDYQNSRLVPGKLPDIGAEKEDILEFRNRWFNWDSVFRCDQMSRMALNLYYWMGRQWVERDESALMEGARGYFFKDMEQPDGVQQPRPVTNYITTSVELELGGLGKRQLTPNVLTNSRDPRYEAAAKVAKQILEHRLKAVNWQDAREVSTFLTIVCGTGCLKSYWDETWEDTITVPSPDAVRCPQCGQSLASPSAPLEAGQDVTAEEGMVDTPLDTCPDCPTPSPLEPYEVPEQELETQDKYGRPMGQRVPKGNTALEVVSPFDLFPENSGIDITPQNCKIWGQASVRSCSWVEERYPDRYDEITPDDPLELMQRHPILGEWGYLGQFSRAMDSGIYDNHVRVYEIHAEKSYRFPMGRSIVIAGDVVLEDGPLYRTVDTENGPLSTPRVRYSAARWKARHGMFWGQSLVDDLISPQNRLNGMDAQVIEARERTGSPNILVSEAMDLSSPEWFPNYGMGKIMRYSTDPLNPTAMPVPFGGEVFPTEVYQERDRVLQDIKELAGPQDVEIGEAPKNITTTSGLQILNEQAERRRGARERALVRMFEVIWEHQLELLWALRADLDEYYVQGAEGQWERKQFDRKSLLGQTKVFIEKQAYVDKSLYQKEATREAQADMLYRLDSQLAIKKLLEYRGLPTDVNEDLNRQVDLAKKQWTDFMDQGIVPVIDKTLDDPRIHFQTLGTLLMSEEGKQREEEVGWGQILKKIAGWEDEMMFLEQADAQAVMFYGGRPSAEEAAPMYQAAMQGFEQQQQGFEKSLSAGEEAASEGEPPNGVLAAPVAPPPPIFLPAAKEDRVYQLWVKLIQRAGGLDHPQPIMTDDPDVPVVGTGEQMKKIDDFLRFRAVVDAYRLYAMEQEMAMMGGGPTAGGAPGQPGSPGSPGGPGNMPGQDFMNPPNPATPNKPPAAPGVKPGGKK